MRIKILFVWFFLFAWHSLTAQDASRQWQYDAKLLKPFWSSETIEGESVLFLRDEKTGVAKAKVLFPIQEIVAVRNSQGDQVYEAGKDYLWKADSRELELPAGSRIVAKTAADLRRPAKSQPYELTHRDGNGEILFGAKLEYAQMQTCITYRPANVTWNAQPPNTDPTRLPRCYGKLQQKEPLKVVVLGDSISTGANASGVSDAPPFQPGYPELVRRGLAENYGGPVELVNLSVGGRDTAWGITQVDAVVSAKPDLVLLAFGMNDSAGRTAEDYKAKTLETINGIRKQIESTEFILVATMLGNRDWIRLKHDVFPKYRDSLLELCGPGIVVADLTRVWEEMLKLKYDWDLTGNGVNHPNDFGHRLYAQVILTTLIK
jgi:acyl-CoA thioesterase I